MKGVAATLRQVAQRIERAVATLVFGEGRVVRTSRSHDLREFGAAAPERVGHQPSRWFWTLRALRHCGVRRSDVFVDFGSGRGRVVYLAARFFPFRRVIGVDVVPELTQIASENLESARPKLRSGEVELVTCDATRFEIPADMSHAYFFNPFTGEVFDRVVDNVVESLARSPRRLCLIYVTPDVRLAEPARCERYIADTGRFAVSWRRSGRRDRSRITVYETI